MIEDDKGVLTLKRVELVEKLASAAPKSPKTAKVKPKKR